MCSIEEDARFARERGLLGALGTLDTIVFGSRVEDPHTLEARHVLEHEVLGALEEFSLVEGGLELESRFLAHRGGLLDDKGRKFHRKACLRAGDLLLDGIDVGVADELIPLPLELGEDLEDLALPVRVLRCYENGAVLNSSHWRCLAALGRLLAAVLCLL